MAGGVGVAPRLALRTAVVEVLLPVRVGGHVGGVNRHVHAVVGKLAPKRLRERVYAVSERRVLLNPS